MSHRVLFVDDEQSILDGLRRLLRPLRAEWEMIFVVSGEEALKEAARTPVDVIVSDMRMPGMNGAELLTRFQAEHPGTVRFVLSGHAEAEAVMQTVSVAHQFLTKPCDKDKVREVVSSALELRELLDSEPLTQLVGSVDSLPSRPEAYSAILKVIADPDAGIADLVKIIESDVAMSAKILQLVNSSFFGLVQPVGDLARAVGLLGLDTLRDLALSIEVFRPPANASSQIVGEINRLHERSLFAASLASRMFTDKRSASWAYTGGMLYDVGLLVLASTAPDHLNDAMDYAQEKQTSLFEAEQELYGVTHAEVGAYLLGAWGLPYPILMAAAYHHRPRAMSGTDFDVASAVHVASVLASSRLGVENDHEMAEIDMAYLESIGCAERLPEWEASADELLHGLREEGTGESK